MGEVEVKNIARPIQVFSVGENRASGVKVTRRRRDGRLFPAMIIFAALVLLIGAVATLNLWRNQTEPLTVERPSDLPAIAVLPFDNISGDPEQEYFADGIAEDLINDLSRISGLLVIARNSSFAYRGQSPDIRAVGNELGVDFVVEGSVRKAGHQIRINVQLIDTATGHNVWLNDMIGKRIIFSRFKTRFGIRSFANWRSN